MNFLETIFVVSAIVFIQLILELLVDSLNKKVRQSMDSIVSRADDLPEDYKKKLYLEEIYPFRMGKEKKKKMGFLTKAIGSVETFVFFFLTYVLIISDISLVEAIKFLGVSASVWLGIKVVGNYGQWSGPVFGRATFYVFLSGSLLNIVFGMSLAFIFLNIFT